jgi:YD repeat-containing protein
MSIVIFINHPTGLEDIKCQSTFSFLQLGRISGTTKTTTYTYDSMNRLKTVTEQTKTTEYTFDLKGNRETVTVTEGSDVTYLIRVYQ